MTLFLQGPVLVVSSTCNATVSLHGKSSLTSYTQLKAPFPSKFFFNSPERPHVGSKSSKYAEPKSVDDIANRNFEMRGSFELRRVETTCSEGKWRWRKKRESELRIG
jgi:hypothetical protein